MRALKFRVWNPVGGEMLVSKELPEYVFANTAYYQINTTEPNPALEDFGQPTHMQYTGMKLADGTEIYEGDVLCFHKEGSPCPASRLIVVWDDEKAAFGYRVAGQDAKSWFHNIHHFAEYHEPETDLLPHCSYVGHAFEREEWRDVFLFNDLKPIEDEQLV